MPYQINSSQLFLTYPQCSLDKQVIYDLLLDKFNPERILVAHELHKNGDHHIHAYLKLNDPYRSTDPKFADIEGYHGNYQGCRSAKNVIKYCSKEEDFISNFDISDTNNRKRLFDELISQQKTLVQIVQENSTLINGYKRLKWDYAEYLQDVQESKADLPSYLPNPWGRVLPTFRATKCRHYWIYSTQPNLGKTFLFAEPLSREYRCFLSSNRELYWNLTGNEQLLIIDEYNTAGFKYSELNSMCDGNYSYRKFMGGVIQLKKPIIIVLSNHSISDLYPHMNFLLYARFNEIKLD